MTTKMNDALARASEQLAAMSADELVAYASHPAAAELAGLISCLFECEERQSMWSIGDAELSLAASAVSRMSPGLISETRLFIDEIEGLVSESRDVWRSRVAANSANYALAA